MPQLRPLKPSKQPRFFLILGLWSATSFWAFTQIDLPNLWAQFYVFLVLLQFGVFGIYWLMRSPNSPTPKDADRKSPRIKSQNS